MRRAGGQWCVLLGIQGDKLTSCEKLGNSKQPHESWSCARRAGAHLPFIYLPLHAYQMLNVTCEVMGPSGELARAPVTRGEIRVLLSGVNKTRPETGCSVSCWSLPSDSRGLSSSHARAASAQRCIAFQRDGKLFGSSHAPFTQSAPILRDEHFDLGLIIISGRGERIGCTSRSLWYPHTRARPTRSDAS